MKNIILLAIFALATSLFYNAKAQNNLQFNRSVYIHLAGAVGGGNAIADVDSIVVPVNKTFKLEFAGASAGGNDPGYYSNMLLDGVVISNSGNSVAMQQQNRVLWLPTGTYNLTLWANGNFTSYADGIVSGIEFNIVP